MARSSGSSAGVVVAGLTAAALAVIGFFAYQAGAAQDRAASHERKPGASDSRSPGSTDKAEKEKKEAALPAQSGTGRRVVYALERERVWLVGKDGKVARTFEVEPSTVSPPPEQYQVSSRTAATTGSDGVPIEHVVRFAIVEGVTVGFSASLDGATPEADPARRTGGIREARADGRAMWEFATIGTKVVVVP